MTHKFLQDKKVINEITKAYELKSAGINDLASFYGVSTYSIRCVLADAGLLVNSRHKTKDETAMLEYLKLHGITKAADLKNRLATHQTAFNYFTTMPLQQRIEWLQQSITQGQPHDLHQPIQHGKLT